MKKLVNGKVVNIDNIELFEKAQIGIIKGAVAVSGTDSTLGEYSDNKTISSIISMYNAFYKSMPYPLYAIEDDIKYATLGCFIKKTEKGCCQTMFVDNGLYIVLDISEMKAIHIVNNSWAVENIEAIKKDNVNMDEYREHIGFEEYTWILNKIVSMDKKANFYMEFMPKFMEACNYNGMVVRWELQNILNFADVGDRLYIGENTIVDVFSDTTYTLDIYSCGKMNTSGTTTRWDLSGSVASASQNNRADKYDYTLYEKENNSSTLKKCSKNWAMHIFGTLCTAKITEQADRFPIYHGVLVGNTLVYEVKGRIFEVCNGQSVEIANSAKIYGVRASNVCIERTLKVDDVYKKVIYAYSLKEHKSKICRISYSEDRDEIN